MQPFAIGKQHMLGMIDSPAHSESRYDHQEDDDDIDYRQSMFDPKLDHTQPLNTTTDNTRASNISSINSDDGIEGPSQLGKSPATIDHAALESPATITTAITAAGDQSTALNEQVATVITIHEKDEQWNQWMSARYVKFLQEYQNSITDHSHANRNDTNNDNKTVTSRIGETFNYLNQSFTVKKEFVTDTFYTPIRPKVNSTIAFITRRQTNNSDDTQSLVSKSDTSCELPPLDNKEQLKKKLSKDYKFNLVPVNCDLDIRRKRTMGNHAIRDSLPEINILSIPSTLGEIVKDVLVYGELALVITFFVLSIVIFSLAQSSKDCKFQPCQTNVDLFGVFEIMFGLLGLIVVTIGVFGHLKKRCESICKEGFRSTYKPDEYSEEEEDSKSDGDGIISLTCLYIKQHHILGPVWNIGRFFLMDAIFYPALLITIFQLIAELTLQSKAESLTWLIAIVGFLCEFVNIYLIRVIFLVLAISSVARVHGETLKSSHFLMVFVIYAGGTMIVQVMMILFISHTFSNDFAQACNKTIHSHISFNGDTTGSFTNTLTAQEICTNARLTLFDVDYAMSSNLVYMILIGFFMPMMAYVMFFVTYKYWTDRLPLTVVAGMMNLIKQKNAKDAVAKSDWNKNLKKANELYGDIRSHHENSKFNLKMEIFNEDTKWQVKLLMPVTNPIVIILCLLYLILLIAFLGCSQPWSGGGWIAIKILSLLFASIVNVYAIGVIAFWVTIIVLFILAIACLIVLVVIILVFLGCILIIAFMVLLAFSAKRDNDPDSEEPQ